VTLSKPLAVSWVVAVSVGCSALTALGIWFFRGQILISGAIAGWMITLAGWFVSARLSQRAQRRMFLHGLLNDARKIVIEAVRIEQAWVGDVQQLGWTFQGQDIAQSVQPSNDPQFNQQARLIQNEAGRGVLFRQFGLRPNLVMVLEEYEQLFPNTRHIRAQMGFRHQVIVERFGGLINDLLSPATHNASVEAMIEQLPLTSDYTAVLEDLRIRVQNVALAEITGKAIPKREPPDPHAVAIMVERADGMLEIVERGTPWPIRVYTPKANAGTPQNQGQAV